MALRFTGTGDDAVYALGSSGGGDGNSMFLSGWWLPETLTATRGLWSIGNTFGVEIDATTDELRMRTDNTTDGQWTTTGVDLAVGVPKFLAFLVSTTNTGPAASWTVWAGDMTNHPAQVTVAQATAPVGNFTGTTNFYIGNKGTGTLAFQGYVEHVQLILNSFVGGSVTRNNPFHIAAVGAITAAEQQLVLERYVMPAWTGNWWWWNNAGPLEQGPAGFTCARYYMPLTGHPIAYGNSVTGGTVMPFTVTVNGATFLGSFEFGQGPKPNTSVLYGSTG